MIVAVTRLHVSLAAYVATLAFVTWVSLPGARTTVPQGDPLVHDVRPGPGVSASRMLSDYLPGLARTPGDTKVYVLVGKDPGGTAVVLGGTHGNEIAGIMSATVLVERARVTRGRLIVIPNANNSAVGYTDPLRPGPEWITIQTPSGARRFKYGARRTQPEHQGAPDPPKYVHPASTEAIDGNEVRNLDRAYPGDADGPLTQRIAAAITKLVRDERADLVFDLHEAGPESRLAWMIVANPKNLDLGALAVLKLEEQGLSMKLEPSSETFRGLSHRELGDATPARAFLFETPNPGQVEKPAGIDVVEHPDYPLSKRVGAHLATLQAVIDVYNSDAAAASRLDLHEVPSLADMVRDGLGKFLK
jgi:predicted deacylase